MLHSAHLRANLSARKRKVTGSAPVPSTSDEQAKRPGQRPPAMTARCTVQPWLPVARRAFVARHEPLIRRLVRAVRPGPIEAFAQVELPEPSAASRWGPTSHPMGTRRALSIISIRLAGSPARVRAFGAGSRWLARLSPSSGYRARGAGDSRSATSLIRPYRAAEGPSRQDCRHGWSPVARACDRGRVARG
jgi:hypothetical protein